jgi:hypothetical protein
MSKAYAIWIRHSKYLVTVAHLRSLSQVILGLKMNEEHLPLIGSQKHGQNPTYPLLRLVITWTGVIGTALLAGYFFILMICQSRSQDFIPQNWLTEIENDHYAALVGTPMCAMTAFCIVSVLKVTNGPIEFDAFGVKFQGASGPIVLWIFCFVAVVAAFRTLWWCHL